MAQAFIDKGVKAFIGWNGSVPVSHTDAATIHLLRSLTIERQTVADAIEDTMRTAGIGPAYTSSLLYYPQQKGQERTSDIDP